VRFGSSQSGARTTPCELGTLALFEESSVFLLRLPELELTHDFW
jgi:hypothetical protein